MRTYLSWVKAVPREGQAPARGPNHSAPLELHNTEFEPEYSSPGGNCLRSSVAVSSGFALKRIAGSTYVNSPLQQKTAHRIWREIPILVAPIQERIRRLPACLNGVEETVAPARIAWALDELS